MAAHTGWSEEEARQIVSAHAAQEGALLPALHALQEAFGCVPEAAVPLLAEVFNLSRADVHGTVTFYHDFRRTPPGRHVVRLCRAESCQARGAEAVAAAFCERTGASFGTTTADGRLTLEQAFCLGLCAVSPAALLDGEPLGRVTADSLAQALEVRT